MKVALLAGGTGGTKLAHGFAMLDDVELSVIVNVADDLELHGLHVSPDIDAVLYTLSGLIDSQRGWGVADDTYTAHAMFARYGEPIWFSLGDADLATHVTRTKALAEGASLTDATASMAAALGIGSRILPATDERCRTVIVTDDGPLEFQEYFVRHRQEPEVRGVKLEGIEDARPTPSVLEAIGHADLVVIGPSNPVVSIGPILALGGVRDAILRVPRRVGVSPIVGGQALKGPAARMLASLGHEVSAAGVARIYGDLLTHWVVDATDAELAPRIGEMGVAPVLLDTIMRTDPDRARLASELMSIR
ncbi:MAG TPA: 2-phospho-L-lactate transferase [Candidatus Limnocylindria bacterium]|nr:2-phospho-L-lactate transferase [Candidatus Limnocylindria bacterium]